jgi:hypothetical protein
VFPSFLALTLKEKRGPKPLESTVDTRFTRDLA